jgi:hypothetical protein
LSAYRFVQTIAVLTAVATLLVIGFPLWGSEADAAPVAYMADRGGHDKGDKPEHKHNKPAGNTNCTLVVPKNPLTAAGLATPYQLVATNKGDGPCNEANADQSAFVEATILDPATGALSVYRPLVVDQGTQPAAATGGAHASRGRCGRHLVRLPGRQSQAQRPGIRRGHVCQWPGRQPLRPVRLLQRPGILCCGHDYAERRQARRAGARHRQGWPAVPDRA